MRKLFLKTSGTLLNFFSWLAPRHTRNIAFGMLSKTKRVPLKEEARAFFASATTHWLEVNGEKTALHQWGDGPVQLLFVHGWMSHSQRWQPFIESLDTTRYTCYGLDAPGQGMSQGKKLNLEIFRQAYVEAVRKVGSVDVVVSHSFGNLAVAYQHLYEDNIDVGSFVVLAAPSGMDSVFQYFRDVYGLSEPTLTNLSVKIDQEFKIPHDTISVPRFLSETDKVVLVVHDESDPVTPIRPIKEAVMLRSSIQTHFTTGLKHTLNEPSIIEAVTEFIQKQTPSLQHVF